jgi:hypothetical protein
MVDYLSVKSHFKTNNPSYYTLCPKSQKPIKAVIRYLPQNTPVEDIYDELVDLGFGVISSKRSSNSLASATFPSRERCINHRMPLCSATTARSLVPSGQIASNLPAASGMGAAICIDTVRTDMLQPVG